ncbi:MAG TPA: PfkB family carbohydrate kinase [Polyangia bacterium]|nr:PfkB family carbohydrate kinase [Polyangia bacterium]
MSQAAGSAKSSLLVVGSVGLDTVETRAGKRAEVLGGAASYFSVAASFLAPVRLTAVVGTDFPAEHTRLLEGHKVDLAGLERVEGRTFRWSGVYAPDFSTRTTLDTQLNVFEKFQPKLPAAYAGSEYVFLANIHPALQLSVLEQASAAQEPKFVACDTMNFWIGGERPALLKLLARVDMLLLNDEEARQLSGEANLPAAARAIRKLGPRAVVIKRGDAGALLFHEGGVFAAPAFPIENVIDPTGAGDSFGGGFMGWLAHEGDTSPTTIRTAMIMGSVLASFCVEDFSLERFKRLDLGQIRERFQAFAELVHFEKIKL